MPKQPCRAFQATGTCRFGDTCKFAHAGEQDTSDNWTGNRKPAGQGRERKNGAYGGARGEQFGWFDEGPSSPAPRHPPRYDPQPQYQQGGSSGGKGSGGDPGKNARRQKLGPPPPKAGHAKSPAHRELRPIPQKPKDPYAEVRKPRPLLDDSWKRGLPPDNFRHQSICPADADINEDTYPDPPENIVHKAYDSTEQYLETHFRLLRADCTLPVRDAIRNYRHGTVEDNEMMIYINVRPMALLLASIGLVHRMSFIVDGRRVNWKQSKRLVPGTLVCLSVDHFEHLRFATVVERDTEFLQNPRELRIGIKFIQPDPRLDFDPDVCYTMIEAMQGYFEAYQHVLKCLQDIDPATLPFQPHLIGLEPELARPEYNAEVHRLSNKDYIQASLIEFPDILKGLRQPSRRRVMDPEGGWLEAGVGEVQPRVLEALEWMLTKEFAVVQGPPGTGKTFLGLLATQIILKECSTAAAGPIIVVCQTNHALDQFLEGIMKFEDRVIRLGSRSKSEVVIPRTLYNVRMKYKEDPMQARNDKVLISGPGRYYRLKDKLEVELLALLEDLAVEYVPLAKLLELNIITPSQYSSFTSDGWVTTADEEDNPTARSWLQDAPHIQDPNDVSIFDDTMLKDDIVPEIDEEELQERVEEFMTGVMDETRISGNVVNVKQSIVAHLDDAVVGDVTPYMNTPNVHDIPAQKRMGVYKIWLQRYQATIIEKLGSLHRTFDLLCENIRAHNRANDASILKTARVIGMTTTAASKYHDLLYQMRPKIMICEEASETLEAHLLCALTPTIEHLILIGDHEQLRPSMSVDDLKSKNIDVSMFERLVLNHFPFAVLDCQRRMRPEIRNLIRPIYRHLRDHASVQQYDDVRGMVDNLWFLTHDEPDRVGQNNSHVNEHEVGIAVKLTIYLLQQGYDPSEITVLAMYAGQRNMIMERLHRCQVPDADKVRVSTVDGFQGEENEIIILSLVRSNSNNSIGFLKTSNRVCVGLSRAKKGMYILGNAKLLMEQSKLWQSIISSMMQGGPSNFKIGNRIKLQCCRHPEMVSEVGLEADFDQVQEGGCSKPCGGVFPACGHPCPFPCHGEDHSNMRCRHTCGRRLSCGVHACAGNCCDPCKSCSSCGAREG
ncbi:unnamed protein product [Mortierella alpina]